MGQTIDDLGAPAFHLLLLQNRNRLRVMMNSEEHASRVKFYYYDAHGLVGQMRITS